MGRRAETGIDDQRRFREICAERFQRRFVHETARGSDRRGPGHQHLATSSNQTLGRAQIVRGVGQHFEAFGAEHGRRLHQAEQLRLQRVVIGDDLAVRQPAVLGSTRTPSCSINSQKPWPVRARADSRRSETVTISVPEASTARRKISGEGYCAVPSNNLEARLAP